MRALAQRMLAGAGYTVLQAADGCEVLKVAGRIDPLAADGCRTPEMNGVQLANELVAARPKTAVLYMSGYPADALGGRVSISSDHYLLKPFTSDALRRKVREILGRE